MGEFCCYRDAPPTSPCSVYVWFCNVDLRLTRKTYENPSPKQMDADTFKNYVHHRCQRLSHLNIRYTASVLSFVFPLQSLSFLFFSFLTIACFSSFLVTIQSPNEFWMYGYFEDGTDISFLFFFLFPRRVGGQVE